MRLARIELKNFRSCKDVEIDLDPYTCFVGPNGAGKSTILAALNVFFRNATVGTPNPSVLTEQDFFERQTDHPVEIKLTFKDLSSEASGQLADYVRGHQLIVAAKARWDEERQSAPVVQVGSRRGLHAFRKYFEADKEGAKAPELKEIYRDLRVSYPGLPSETVKSKMAGALRKFEQEHPDQCEEIESEDQFYGFSRGADRLSRLIQWVYVPAVKDASGEQREARNTAIGELLQRTFRSKVSLDSSLDDLRQQIKDQYDQLIAPFEENLQELSEQLQARLREWVSQSLDVNLSWDLNDPKLVGLQAPVAQVLIGDGAFIGDVSRAGHGIQRSFIVSLLQELASSRAEGQPTLLLGVEEPELYQHPPQAQHFASVLEALTENAEDSPAQVLVTSHSPYFISRRGFERVRLVRSRGPGGLGSKVSQATFERVQARVGVVDSAEETPLPAFAANMEQVLRPSLREMFFCRVPVFVEGIEDVAFLASYMHLNGTWSDFRRMGCHFVQVGGKDNLYRPIAIAEELGLPCFAIFDADGDSKPDSRAKNETANQRILRLLTVDLPETLSLTDPLIRERVVMWPTNIKREVQRSIGDRWVALESEAKLKAGLQHKVKEKNPVLIAAILEQAVHAGESLQVLEDAVQAVFSFAGRVPDGVD